MAAAMVILNSKGEACSVFYTRNLRLDYVSGGLLFRLSAKLVDPLVYSGLLKFALPMGTDSLLTVIAFKQGMEVDWGKTATKDRFFHYDSTGEEVLTLKQDSAQVSKCTRGSTGSSKNSTLAAVLVFFLADRQRVDITNAH